MKVGDSVRLAVDDWRRGELQAAMLHACNAVDGTAAKLYPALGSNARFTTFLRDNYTIFGAMAAPGVAFTETRWPVKVAKPKAAGGKPDIADVIYGIHRCVEGHGDELPEGFDLVPDTAGPDRQTQILVEKGRVRLSDRVIFGLLAVAVVSPVNATQAVPADYYLTLGSRRFPINEWWGRRADFEAEALKVAVPYVTLNFDDWIEDL